MKYYDERARCLVCRRLGVDLHHTKARAAGGTDSPLNLMPLCHQHHVEIHNIGTYSFVMKFVCVGRWLSRKGWDLQRFNRKWVHLKEGQAHD